MVFLLDENKKMIPEIIIIILIVLIGAALGSFLNVCIYRIPAKKSIVLPASHCPSCNKAIPFYHNIPIISFLFLGGKCKFCHAKIDIHYPIVEFITPLLILFLYFKYGLSFTLLRYLLFIIPSVVIFFIDSKHKIIPNLIVLPMIILGFVSTLLPQVDFAIMDALKGAAGGFLLFYLVAVVFEKVTGKEGLGGGDIKFIAAIGSFVGIFGLIFTIFFGSLFALVAIVITQSDFSKEFPFGPFLVVGSALYIYLGDMLIYLYLSLYNL